MMQAMPHLAKSEQDTHDAEHPRRSNHDVSAGKRDIVRDYPEGKERHQKVAGAPAEDRDPEP